MNLIKWVHHTTRHHYAPSLFPPYLFSPPSFLAPSLSSDLPLISSLPPPFSPPPPFPPPPPPPPPTANSRLVSGAQIKISNNEGDLVERTVTMTGSPGAVSIAQYLIGARCVVM